MVTCYCCCVNFIFVLSIPSCSRGFTTSEIVMAIRKTTLGSWRVIAAYVSRCGWFCRLLIVVIEGWPPTAASISYRLATMLGHYEGNCWTINMFSLKCQPVWSCHSPSWEVHGHIASLLILTRVCHILSSRLLHQSLFIYALLSLLGVATGRSTTTLRGSLELLV